MKYGKTLAAFLALGGAFFSCQEPEPETLPVLPVTIENLVTPRNNMSVNISNADDGLTFEWEATQWRGEGAPSYTLVFDVLGGDFTEPLKTFPTEETLITLTKENLREVFNLVKEEGNQFATLSWSVVAKSGEDELLAEMSRNLILDGTLNPAIVDFLNAPADNTMVNLLRNENGIEFQWSAAEWDGEGTVSYQVQFFLAEGGSAEPVKTFPATENSLTLTNAQLAEVLAAGAASGEKTVKFNWSVKSIVGELSWNSAQMLSISISNDPATAFQAGEDLYFGCDGDENGRKVLYVYQGYYNETSILENTLASAGEGEYGYYEIYVKLEAGKPYWFYTGTADAPESYIKGSELLIVESKAEAETTVDKTGVYRIRINPATHKTGLATVKSVVLRRTWDGANSPMSYVGNGVWSIADHNINCILASGGTDERYRFVMTLTDAAGTDVAQAFSQNTFNDNRPTKDSSAEYWYLQPTKLDQWTNVWKYPAWLIDSSDMDKWYADVNLILNADAAHYTHEFKDEFEWGQTEDFMNGYTLRIGGEGTEAGQKFTYVSAGYYNTASNFADRLDPIEGNYYEMFTKIEAGKPFYFYCDEKAESTWYFKSDRFDQAISQEAASVQTVSETAVYRIRINVATKEIRYTKVNEVMLDYPWGEDNDAVLEYVSKGKWQLLGYHPALRLTGWAWDPIDTRYKFNMALEGLEGRQGLGKKVSNIDQPDETFDASYWHLQITGGGTWDEALFRFPKWMFDPNDNTRYSTDITLYLNDDKGHYTHEFTNTVDHKEVITPDALEELYIGVEGSSEDGHKMTWIEEGYYKTDNDSWKDRFDSEGWGTDSYYEAFVRLDQGDKYYLYTKDSNGNKSKFYNPTNYESAASADEAAATAAEGNVYRLRVKPSSSGNKVSLVKVEWVVLRYAWGAYGDANNYNDATMTYAGKGKWTFDYYSVDLKSTAEKRYRFLIKYPDYSAQGLSQNDNSKSHSDPAYYDVHLSYTGWDFRVFTFPDNIISGSTASCSKVNLYMNDDKGHYTHEFVQ